MMHSLKKHVCRLILPHSVLKYGIAEIVTNLIELDCTDKMQDNNQPNESLLHVSNAYVSRIEALLNSTDIYYANSDGVTILELVCRICISYLSHSSKKLRVQVILGKFFEKVSNDFWRQNNKVKQLLLDASDLVKFLAVVFSRIEVTWFVLCRSIFSCKQYALRYAILFAKLDKAKILIKHGANVKASDLRYYIDHCQNYDRNSELLKILLKKTNVLLESNRLGVSPLEYLLRFGNKKTVKTLLKSVTGIPLMKFQFGQSLLHVLIENNNAEVLNVLEELNILFDVNARRLDGKTCLMTATAITSIKAIELLLKHHANVNLTINSKSEFIHFHGNTALRIAIKLIEDYNIKSSKRLEEAKKIMVLLLQNGAFEEYICGSIPNHFRTDMVLEHLLVRYAKLGPSMNIYFAHLALLNTIDASALDHFAEVVLQEDDLLRVHFQHCIKEIEDMKCVKVLKEITLFDILNEKTEKMIKWVGKPEFITSFNAIIEKNSRLRMYYLEALKWRVAKALDMGKQQTKAVPIIEEITGFDAHAYYIVVVKIIDYLDQKDFNNLFRIKSVYFTPN